MLKSNKVCANSVSDFKKPATAALSSVCSESRRDEAFGA